MNVQHGFRALIIGIEITDYGDTARCVHNVLTISKSHKTPKDIFAAAFGENYRWQFNRMLVIQNDAVMIDADVTRS
jgi:hypothetical protein